MAVKTETSHAGEFLVSEGNGTISREEITLTSGSNLAAGTVIARTTATGKWVILAPAGAGGNELARGILYDACDASAGDKQCMAITLMAEVNDKELIYPGGITGPQKTTAIANLRFLSLIVVR